MILAAGLVLVGVQAWAAGDDAKGNASKTAATTAEIARLIEHLGSETVTEREAAQKALEKIGEPASEALWDARYDKNAERAARAWVTLRRIVESAQRKRIREADEQISALIRQWKQACKARPAVDANEIPGLIEQLGAATAADRSTAQAALAKMGLAATEALAAATRDANPERAARAKDALAQMAIRKEDWPVSWKNVTFSYRILSPDPTECKALSIDAQRRAVFLWWNPTAKAFAKAEWTVQREEADMLHRVMGNSRPWVSSESSFESRQADNARVELVITLGDRFARFCEPLPPFNPPPGSRIMSIDTLNKIMPLQGIAHRELRIWKQSVGARPAAVVARGEGKKPQVPAGEFGEEEALAQARKLIAEARRTGKPLPTGDRQPLASADPAGPFNVCSKAREAQTAYEKTYNPVGKKSQPGKADPNTPAGREAFAKVERMYLDAIKKFGVNKYGASAQQELARAYRYAGCKDRFEELNEQARRTELVAAQLKRLTRSRREGGDWPELAALMRLLHNPGKVTLEDLAAPLSKLGKRSDEAVAAITEEFWASGYRTAYRSRVIWALSVMDSPASRKALLKLALDGEHKDNPSHIRSAAREYIRRLPDKAGATCLLAAPDSDVVMQAIGHLRGEPIDKDMFDRLGELMRTGDREIRFQVVQNFGQDPGGKFVAEKVAAIVKAIPEIAGMPEADKTAWPGNWTNAELRYRLYFDALSRMTIPPDPINKALASAKEGNAVWRCLVLACGLSGDAKVRPGLRKILAGAKGGMFRAWACEALGRIGSAEDLPLLRETAAKDPMQRKRGGCIAPVNKELFHPVREAAGRAIKLIEEGKGD